MRHPTDFVQANVQRIPAIRSKIPDDFMQIPPKFRHQPTNNNKNPQEICKRSVFIVYFYTFLNAFKHGRLKIYEIYTIRNVIITGRHHFTAFSV